MSEPYDGGPAFPCPSVSTHLGHRAPDGYPGMTLRAYFAAHAPEAPGDFMRADVPCVRELAGGRKEVGTRLESALEWAVRWRLQYADAMLKALK